MLPRRLVSGATSSRLALSTARARGSAIGFQFRMLLLSRRRGRRGEFTGLMRGVRYFSLLILLSDKAILMMSRYGPFVIFWIIPLSICRSCGRYYRVMKSGTERTDSTLLRPGA